jgi:hypothetical protein
LAPFDLIFLNKIVSQQWVDEYFCAVQSREFHGHEQGISWAEAGNLHSINGRILTPCHDGLGPVP